MAYSNIYWFILLGVWAKVVQSIWCEENSFRKGEFISRLSTWEIDIIYWIACPLDYYVLHSNRMVFDLIFRLSLSWHIWTGDMCLCLTWEWTSLSGQENWLKESHEQKQGKNYLMQINCRLKLSVWMMHHVHDRFTFNNLINLHVPVLTAVWTEMMLMKCTA